MKSLRSLPLTFEGCSVEKIGPFFRLSSEGMRDRRLSEKVEWASQIGDFWILYQVDVNHPSVLTLVSSWEPALTPGQKKKVVHDKRDSLGLSEAEEASLADLALTFPLWRVGLSFMAEGTALCLFGRSGELSVLEGIAYRAPG